MFSRNVPRTYWLTYIGYVYTLGDTGARVLWSGEGLILIPVPVTVTLARRVFYLLWVMVCDSLLIQYRWGVLYKLESCLQSEIIVLPPPPDESLATHVKPHY